jgi:hypothetical protein
LIGEWKTGADRFRSLVWDVAARGGMWAPPPASPALVWPSGWRVLREGRVARATRGSRDAAHDRSEKRGRVGRTTGGRQERGGSSAGRWGARWEKTAIASRKIRIL